jgi:hypothetical protein
MGRQTRARLTQALDFHPWCGGRVRLTANSQLSRAPPEKASALHNFYAATLGEESISALKSTG